MFFDPMYFLYIAPAFILAMIAQMWVQSAYARASKVPVGMSGAAASRKILDAAGLYDVAIQEIPGKLSDHYDPRDRVLRLSSDVFHGRSAASVGIAAHEAGHALQHANHYAPLIIRNLAVPAASFGSGAGVWMIILGVILNFQYLVLLGIAAFSAVAFFQLVNLPVEFNASSRAKQLLVQYGIVGDQEYGYVRSVLSAAALTYVAATLQSVMILLYYVMRFTGDRGR